jgi:hypothetical protein
MSVRAIAMLESATERPSPRAPICLSVTRAMNGDERIIVAGISLAINNLPAVATRATKSRARRATATALYISRRLVAPSPRSIANGLKRTRDREGVSPKPGVCRAKRTARAVFAASKFYPWPPCNLFGNFREGFPMAACATGGLNGPPMMARLNVPSLVGRSCPEVRVCRPGGWGLTGPWRHREALCD